MFMLPVSATFKPKLVGGRFQLLSTCWPPSSSLSNSLCPFHALLPLEAEVRDVSFFIPHWCKRALANLRYVQLNFCQCFVARNNENWEFSVLCHQQAMLLIINARDMKEAAVTVYSFTWHTDTIMYCVYY